MARVLSRALIVAAERAGWAAGKVRRSGYGLGGALCVSLGLGEVYRPLFLIAAGVFLLVLDGRR